MISIENLGAAVFRVEQLGRDDSKQRTCTRRSSNTRRCVSLARGRPTAAPAHVTQHRPARRTSPQAWTPKRPKGGKGRKEGKGDGWGRRRESSARTQTFCDG